MTKTRHSPFHTPWLGAAVLAVGCLALMACESRAVGSEEGVQASWGNEHPEGNPGPRTGHGLIYDSARGRAVLFGGIDARYTLEYLSDTWEFDGINWIETSPSGSPPGRSGNGLVYDMHRQRVVLFGGRCGNVYCRLGDTWEFDGATWYETTPASSPAARGNHALAYDASRNRVVLFAGHTGGYSGIQADTWEYDGINWIEVGPIASPPERYGHAMAYDSERGYVILFGGTTGINASMNDTWEYDGITWRETTPAVSPPARDRPSLAYDAQRGRTILFGGLDSGGALGDTWEYDGETWFEAAPVNAPSPRSNAGLTFSGENGKILLYGGYRDDTLFDDTWTYGVEGSAW